MRLSSFRQNKSNIDCDMAPKETLNEKMKEKKIVIWQICDVKQSIILWTPWHLLSISEFV